MYFALELGLCVEGYCGNKAFPEMPAVSSIIQDLSFGY